MPLVRGTEEAIADHLDNSTFAELGYADLVISSWTGLVASKGTLRNMLEKRAGQVRPLLPQLYTAKAIEALGMSAGGTDLGAFDAQVAREIEAFTRIAKARGIKGE